MKAPIPAVAMAPAACDEALVAAAAVSVPDAALVEVPESPLSLSVLLVHSALKPEVLLEHALPRVSLVPVAKLTAAHYQYDVSSILQVTGILQWGLLDIPGKECRRRSSR